MRALILVDIQNDFMPFGTLPVPDGDQVVEAANIMAPRFELVVATQDWHPAGHGSFASAHLGCRPGTVVELGGVQQVLWPDHCVQGTPGASFHSALDVSNIDHIVRKGTDPGIDSYSGFYDNDNSSDTGLRDYLVERGVEELVIMGLATDYCVKYTVLDAVGLGFDVTVVSDGCRPVDMQAGDGDLALDEMRAAGAHVAVMAGLVND